MGYRHTKTDRGESLFGALNRNCLAFWKLTMPAVLIPVAALLVMESCRKNTGEPFTEGNRMLTVFVSIPQQEESLHTRGTNGTEEESAIGSLTFFIFDSDGAREQYHSISIDPEGNSTDPMWDKAKKALRITVTPGEKRIYCIANWAVTPTADMPDLAPVTDSTALVNSVRNYSSQPVNPPVMSGRAHVDLSGSEQELTIDLVRQVARVRIYPMISAELGATPDLNISLQGVKFMKMNRSAYIFSYATLASPASGTFDGDSFLGSPGGAITATSCPEAELYDHGFYVPENIALSGAGATYMVLWFDYNGTDTYYSVVINGDNVSPHDRRWAVQRNHSYNYYLTLHGIGSPTEPESYPETRTDARALEYELLTEPML